MVETVDNTTLDHIVVEEMTMEDVVEDGDMEEREEGVAVRMRAREIGMASILAWGETRGRYLDD